MSRKLARESVMQGLYQMAIHNEYEIEMMMKLAEKNHKSLKDLDYIDNITKSFIEHKETVDENISACLKKGWTLDRIAIVDLAILRLAVTELLYIEDIPMKVAINEAIEIGKRFGTENSGKFISGVLGTISHKENIDE